MITAKIHACACTRELLLSSLCSQLHIDPGRCRNLDSLWDALGELREPVYICIYGAAVLRGSLGAWYERLERLLLRARELMGIQLEIYETEESNMDVKEAREKLRSLQEKMSAYNHAMGILSYDGATTAPKGTAANRGQTMSILSEESYKLSTGRETVDLLEYLDSHKDELDIQEQRMVYLLLKSIRQMQKTPMEEYVALQRLLVEADDVWHRAKENSDFALFEPVLAKIFDAYRRIAGYCAPDKAPYDYWLDQFEEGLNMSKCDEFFATLRQHIVPLLEKVKAAAQLDDSMIHGVFPASDQARLSERLMSTMGIDTDHCGLGTTEHPFTTSLGSHFDERITTHYYEDNFASSMFSVIHEGGHALYDMGSDDALTYTVLDGGVSMGIHESQSRFYENLLGRSHAFCQYLFPVLEGIFPQQLAGHSAEDLYRAVNRAEPSLIRTEADELTYCLHIMVRYDLEKRLMSGELKVHDLPGEWNRLYKEYLGIDVPNDKAGVLQDSHWSGGAIGYFPSYALGSAYGVQFLRKMRESVDVDACLLRGDFGPINQWNREHIWKYGSTYSPMQLFEMATGENFDPTVYTSYLEEKYGRLYGII